MSAMSDYLENEIISSQTALRQYNPNHSLLDIVEIDPMFGSLNCMEQFYVLYGRVNIFGALDKYVADMKNRVKDIKKANFKYR